MGKWVNKLACPHQGHHPLAEMTSCWYKDALGQPQVHSAESARGRVRHTPHPFTIACAQHLREGRTLRSESKSGIATIRDHGAGSAGVRTASCPVCVAVRKAGTCESPQDGTPKKVIFTICKVLNTCFSKKTKNSKSPKPGRALFLNLELLYSK